MQSTNEREPPGPIPQLGPEVYAIWRGSTCGAITERLERELILELAGDVRGRCVLDVGCGDGDLAITIWKRGASVVGIDASHEMVMAARARATQEGADVEFQVASAERLPFAAERFDVVTAITVLCFVDDAAPGFREIARVLRPGGRLVIGELGKWSAWAAWRRIRAWLGSELWRRARFRTARELRNLSREAGLVPGPVQGAIYYPPWGRAASLLHSQDRRLRRMTSVGAAFLALSAVKPPAGRNPRSAETTG